jgi:hypothetical protein
MPDMFLSQMTIVLSMALIILCLYDHRMELDDQSYALSTELISKK